MGASRRDRSFSQLFAALLLSLQLTARCQCHDTGDAATTAAAADTVASSCSRDGPTLLDDDDPPDYFGTARPQQIIALGTETTLFEHSCKGARGCLVTQFWVGLQIF